MTALMTKLPKSPRDNSLDYLQYRILESGMMLGVVKKPDGSARMDFYPNQYDCQMVTSAPFRDIETALTEMWAFDPQGTYPK